MKVDGSLKSLLQGVSQQPARDRLPGQASAQENMTSDPVRGLSKKPPSDLVASLGVTSDARGFFDFAVRTGEKFLAFFRNNSVIVTDYNGTVYPCTVSAAAQTYLSTAGEYKFGLFENSVFISNKGKSPKMLDDTPVYYNQGAGATSAGLVQILGGQYGKSFRIKIDGTQVALYTAPDGSVPTESLEIDTTYIAEQLRTNFSAAGYTISRQDDILRIVKTDGTPFDLDVVDGYGNTLAKAMTTQVPGTEDLPRLAPHLYVARVATETDPEEDLWFKFVLEDSDESTAAGTGFGKKGYWQETVAPDIKYKLDPATMPIVLEYDPVAQEFSLDLGDWEERRVGTDVSNPQPSFIGTPINDIATFQSRLVFVAGSNVIMSRTNKRFDYWAQSASAIADSDPIDISSTAVQASTMLSITPFNRDLVIWSTKGQFVIFGRTSLTPQSAAMVLTTAFEGDLRADPVPSGRNVFFATNFGRFTGIREFYTEGAGEINDTRPITQHVKEFILGNVTKLTSSSNYDTLLVHTDTSSNRIYQYQFIWSDNEKVQSSWSWWSLPHTCVYSFFDEEVMYFITVKNNEYYLLRASLDVPNSEGMNFPVYLDYRFDAFEIHTQLLLPFDFLADETLVAVQGAGCPNPGMAAKIESVAFNVGLDGYVVTFEDDMAGGNVIIGIPFKARYVPTMPFVKDQDGVVISTGRLRVNHFLITLRDSAYVLAKVLSKYWPGEEVRYDGRIVGDINNVVGEPALINDQFYIPFREDTSDAEFEIYSESFYPMTLLDIEWKGQYTKRGRRIAAGGD